jgi:hypothetical protein
MRVAGPVSLLLAVSIPMAFAVGCGGGPEQVSAAELVQKGDQICRQQQSRFTEIQAAPLVTASDGAEEAEALHEAAQESLDELRDLEPPEPQRFLSSVASASSSVGGSPSPVTTVTPLPLRPWVSRLTRTTPSLEVLPGVPRLQTHSRTGR